MQETRNNCFGSKKRSRNNCCEFLASYGVIFQSVIKPFFKTRVFWCSIDIFTELACLRKLKHISVTNMLQTKPGRSDFIASNFRKKKKKIWKTGILISKPARFVYRSGECPIYGAFAVFLIMGKSKKDKLYQISAFSRPNQPFSVMTIPDPIFKETRQKQTQTISSPYFPTTTTPVFRRLFK